MDTHTHIHTHRTTTVTFAAHARRGLIIYIRQIYTLKVYENKNIYLYTVHEKGGVMVSF